MILLAMMATGCGAGGTDEPALSPQAGGGAAAPLSVYAVNYPLMYFAQRIGGAHVAVVFPAPADDDQAFWQPGVEIITAYQNADIIVRNGATYAKWMGRPTPSGWGW